MVAHVTCTILGITPEVPLNNPHLKQHYQCRTQIRYQHTLLAPPSLERVCFALHPSCPSPAFPGIPSTPHKARLPLEPAQPQSCHVQDAATALELLCIPASQHTSLHPWPGTPKHLLAATREVQQRGSPLSGCGVLGASLRAGLQWSHPPTRGLLMDFFRICS